MAQWAKDRGPLPFGRSFQGWIYAFDAAKLALTGKYRTTRTPDDATLPPDGEDPAGGGGVWQASAGPASDGRGSLYFSTGNQAQGFAGFKTAADPLGRNLPDSVVRLRVDRRPMTPTDWFTPYRKVWLDLEDLDLAAAGVVLIPNSRYLVAAGKEGILYVLDRDNLGRFDGSVPFDETTLTQPVDNPPPPPQPQIWRIHHTSDDPVGLDDPGRDQVVQKFRISENQYCRATGPNSLFCLGPGRDYARDGIQHRGVDTSSWMPWPHVHGTPIFGAFPDGSAFLYVWPEKDFLKSFRWWGKQFDTTATKIGISKNGEKLLAPPYIANLPCSPPQPCKPTGDQVWGMPGGFLSLTIDPTKRRDGVLFASVQRCLNDDDQVDKQATKLEECRVDRCSSATQTAKICMNQLFGILRAFDADTLDELWNNQNDEHASPADKKYYFAKFVPPTIAHGRVFLATGSGRVLVYGRH